MLERGAAAGGGGADLGDPTDAAKVWRMQRRGCRAERFVRGPRHALAVLWNANR